MAVITDVVFSFFIACVHLLVFALVCVRCVGIIVYACVYAQVIG